MADDFSQSLTPPVSPFGADSSCELIAARPPCFCCSETKNDPTGSLSTEGYVTRGFLKRYSHQQFHVLTKVQPATRRFTCFFYLDNFAIHSSQVKARHRSWCQSCSNIPYLKITLKYELSCATILFIGCSCVLTRPLQNMRLTLLRSLASPG